MHWLQPSVKLHVCLVGCNRPAYSLLARRAGPIGHYFYHGMDKVVTRYFKIGTFGFVVAKVLGDELLFGPIHVGGYFAWMTLAEGGSWQVSFPELVCQAFMLTLISVSSRKRKPGLSSSTDGGAKSCAA